jgi:hypothetical protein
LENEDEVNMSLSGLWFRVYDKLSRLKSLVLEKKQAANEPVIDAWKDMSVYGLIAQLVMNGKWAK